VSGTARELPVRETARAIWRDALLPLFAHPLLWTVCLALYGTITFLDFQWVEKPGLISGVGPIWQGVLADALTLLLSALSLVPAALATHRFVILGIAERPAAILADRGRMGRYAALECLILICLIGLTALASVAIRWSDAMPDNHLVAFAAIVTLLAVLAFMGLVILRAAACFPAIAVSNGWKHVVEGWRALTGQMFRLIVLAVITPVGAVAIILLGAIIVSMILADPDAAPVADSRMNIGLTMAMVPLAYLWVLTMSHIYRAVMTIPAEVDRPR
jgi:hypothetical protein